MTPGLTVLARLQLEQSFRSVHAAKLFCEVEVVNLRSSGFTRAIKGDFGRVNTRLTALTTSIGDICKRCLMERA